MTDQNPGLAHDVWMLLKLFPWDRRYALYGEWKHKTYAAIPQLGVAKAGCISDAKYTMRRLSKETVKRFGRYTGKTAHANPTIAFEYTLNLLQTYENQIPVVVEGSRYMSELSFDVLAFTIVEQLCAGKAARVQQGGIGVTVWVRSLSTFAGQLVRKHPVEMAGMLRYLMARLVQGGTGELILLQEIVAQMSGIKPLTDDVTSDQVNALAGGDVLKREVFGYEAWRVVKKSAGRLVKSLEGVEGVVSFAVLMGQWIGGSVFVEGVGEVKILGWMLDNTRSTFNQYMDFLSASMDPAAYSALVPDIAVLRNTYGLAPEVAFAILRPKLHHLVSSPLPPATTTSSEMQVDNGTSSRVHAALLPVLESVQQTLPAEVWKILSPQFYVTFWSLSLYDIEYPHAQYISEIAKLKAAMHALQSDKSVAAGGGAARRKKEVERMGVTIGLLEKERVVHEKHVGEVRGRLGEECRSWFPSKEPADLQHLVTLLLQHCIIPRSLISPSDALFAGKFMFLAHSLGVPNLMTLPFFDKLLHRNNQQSMIYLCTEMEARNYGRVLRETLGTLNSWFTSKSVYEKACMNPTVPGFAIRWKPDPVTLRIPVEDLMQHKDFHKIMYKWHAALHKTITLNLESGEYAQITNSIILLDKISEYFPMVREQAVALEKSCLELVEKETERKDLKLM
ncbi:THO complex subunit 2, partial [Podochytrium sp. JEL0797]